MGDRITEGLSDWVAQENYVERLMDNSAFTAAHPDDTLVLAGPARFGVGGNDIDDFIDSLLPIGSMMNFTMAANAPVQPLTAIGSGRTFFVRGKGNITFSIGRLFVNGRNLLRVLYTSAIQQGIKIHQMDDPAMARYENEQYVVNLDSELFYVPFGMACLFRDKSRSPVGAFYIELAMLNTYNIGIASGQAMIMENINGVADRILPIFPGSQTPTARKPDEAPSLADLNGVLGIPGGTTDPRLVAQDFVPSIYKDVPDRK
jgi:hypothetical protein